LTTADQPNQQIAQQATALLIADSKSKNVEFVNKVFTPELITRDSSARHIPKK
jgi:LacI family transcriptional regulator